MLKALVLTQLRGMLSGRLRLKIGGKKGRLGNKVLIALAAVYIVGSLSLSLGFYFNVLLAAFRPLELVWFYFALAGLLAFALSFVGSVFLAQSSLFGARDNELLLSMPIKPAYILIARTVALYLICLFFQALVLLPAFVVWLLSGAAGLAGILLFVLAGLLLPLPTLALSILLGWLLALVSARLRRKNLMIILLSLAFLAAYFVGYTRLIGAMQELISRGQEMALAVRATIPPAYHYGVAVAQGDGASLLAFAAFCLLPFGLVMLAVSLNYSRALTTRHGAPRLLYKGGGLRAGSPMKALTVKELRRFFGSPIYLMNAGIGLLFMLALPVYLLFDQSALDMMMLELNLPEGAVGAFAVLALSMLAGSVFISSASISLEGRALWIIQSLPVRPIQSLLAKALAHVLVCLPPILVSSIALGIILRLDALIFILCLVLPTILAVYSALLGLLLNLSFPKLDWLTEAEPVKQSMSTFLTMGLGFLSVASLAALYGFLLASRLSLAIYLLICALLLLLLSLLMYLRLKATADRAYLDLSER